MPEKVIASGAGAAVGVGIILPGITAAHAGAATTAPVHVTAQISTSIPGVHPAPQAQRYRVRRGDTLAGIAQTQDVTGGWQTLFNDNLSIKDPNVIYPGQDLALGGGGAVRAYTPPGTGVTAVFLHGHHLHHLAHLAQETGPPAASPGGASSAVQAPAQHTEAVADTSHASYSGSFGYPFPASTNAAIAEVYGTGSNGHCAAEIIEHESGGNPGAENPSGAYGLPQSLPGSKMASAGPDWQTNPVTQLRWQLGYADETYGSICNAAAHDLGTGTY